MGFGRFAVAALSALILYVGGSLAAIAIQAQTSSARTVWAQPLAGVAYADAASDACSSYNGDALNACQQGNRDATADGSVAQDQSCGQFQDANHDACVVGYQTGSQAAGASSSSIDENACAASVSGFGWIACPLFDQIIHFFTNAAKDLVTRFMAIQPLSMSGGLYDTWSGVKILANTLFVLIFLVIIFAHTLQYNLDGYALKKMIPKIAAAAVLVQFSFVLSSLLVDLGNILGVGVGLLLDSLTHGGHPTAPTIGGVIENVTNGIIGVAIVGGLVSIATTGFALAGPVFIMILLTAFAVIVTLAFRYFMIGVLIVVSPLALIAWVLPNTEQYFTKWLSMFIKLILMYPIIMGLMSVAGDVGGLIPASTTAAGISGHLGQDVATSVIKILVIAGCFLQIPKTFQWAGSIMNDVNSRVHAIAGGLRNRYWNSPNVAASKGTIKMNLIRKADRIESAFAGNEKEGLYRFLGAGSGIKNGWLQKRRQGMLPLTTALLTAQSTDRSMRQHAYSAMVESHTKFMSEYDEAKDMHAVESALTSHYIGERLRVGAHEPEEASRLRKLKADADNYLKQINAQFLGSYPYTPERREALMNILGKNNMLKPPLQNHIQRLGNKHELEAFLRQDFGNYGKQPAVTGITVNGDVKPQVGEILNNLSASQIASDNFMNRNFMVSAGTGTDMELQQAKQIAQMIANEMNGAALQLNFTHRHQHMMSQNKQANMLLTMVRNHEFYRDGRGRQIKSTIINQILRDMKATGGTSHRETLQMFEKLLRENGNEIERMGEYLNFLHDIEYSGDVAGETLDWDHLPRDEDGPPVEE